MIVETEHSESSIPMSNTLKPYAIIPPLQIRRVYVPVIPPQLDLVAECEKTVEAMWRMLPN